MISDLHYSKGTFHGLDESKSFDWLHGMVEKERPELYHQTKDILYVKEFLGHRRLDSTLIYINIEKALFYKGKPEEFHVKIAQTPEEIKGLLEVGFEYVCEKDDLLFFRKRK